MGYFYPVVTSADAQAICEAVRRPHMRFVPIKDESQQAMQCLHRTRQGFIQEKTTKYNRLRRLISEFGVIAPQSTNGLRHMVSAQKYSLPFQVQQYVDDLLEHVDRIEANIAEYDRILSHMVKTDHRSQRLMELKGISPTTACVLVASIGNVHDFKNGVSLDIENYCTLRLFFDLSTLADLSRRNLPEVGIRLLFQI